MKTKSCFSKVGLGRAWLPALAVAASLGVSARVVDDFNDNTKTGWADSDPAHLPSSLVPPRVETNQRFEFFLPPLGQSYFVSSTKTTELFELKEGRTIEFRVDIVNGYGGDSFAVVAWIPQATGADSLAGYGIAKSETDMLITKGINKYFYNETPTPAVKNNNVTLVLNLKVKGGKVIIRGQVQDKDDNDKVIFDKTFEDGPGADVMADGTDSPPAPFITTGNFVLYLYANDGKSQDHYEVVFDNAEVLVTDEQVLDNFDDNTKTGWADSDPAHLPGALVPPRNETNQRFEFFLPPLGQSYFVNSTKTTKAFELAEGTRHEFRVDLVNGYGADSFAVLAWIPTVTGADSLAGYGIAKSETDVLITKGINKYFYNENPTPALKNDNVTLALILTVHNGNVIITGQVLDKDDSNHVIFEKTFVDTPAADVMSDGSDSPPAPFITTGNVVLYLYEDGGTTQDHYEVVYDNLAVAAPPAAANEAPLILEVQPIKGANFLPASTQISFKATDDKALPDAGISINLNGTVRTTANGVVLSGPTNARTVTLGGLAAGQNYVATLSVVDSEGVATTQAIYFDTFPASIFTIEVEDYNFTSGGFLANPDVPQTGIPSGNSYFDRVGVEGTDFHETRATPNNDDTQYRTQDPVRMQKTLDLLRAKYADLGGPDQLYIDYDVGDIAAGEWLNYTRDFPAGSYQVYLREAVVNFDQVVSALELVTGDRTQPNQTTRSLGSFIGKLSGFTYRNVALTDPTGNPVILRLSGVTTLRLNQVEADTSSSARYQNYLVFLPVADPGVQRATVSSVSPANGSTTETVTPQIVASIQNRDTSVKTDTIQLVVNGTTVGATVAPTADGATVTYNLTPLPAAGAVNTAKLTFKDNLNVEIGSEWSFIITYKSLDAANRQAGPGKDRGFVIRTVQAPIESGPLENNLERAEQQLAPNSPWPAFVDFSSVRQVINMAQDDRNSGYFPDEYLVPGISVEYSEDFTVEIRAYLDLPAGLHRFGVVTDDGYKISAGATPADKTPLLAFHNGGPANETFDFVVPVAGLYGFRMVWYERGGNAFAEWFSVDLATGTRTLINDPDSPNAVKAYQDVVPAPAVKLQSSAVVTGFFADTAATIDTVAKKVTVPASGAAQFYRLSSATALRITSITLAGGNVVITYE